MSPVNQHSRILGLWLGQKRLKLSDDSINAAMLISSWKQIVDVDGVLSTKHSSTCSGAD